MLFQTSRREVPDHDAFVAHLAIRHPSFRITAMRSRGVITDLGMAASVVQMIARQDRSQLALLLAGHGYFDGTPLRPGDIVLSDQCLIEPEGYGGSPCEVIHIEWDDDSFFGQAHRGRRAIARITQRDVDAFRDLLARVHRTPVGRWTRELGALLRAIGLDVQDGFEEPRESKLADIYRLVGQAGSMLGQHPALTDLADSLGLTSRQVRRHIKKLIDEYRQPYDGWRDYVSDMRLEWTSQLLSLDALKLTDVARIAGFRSDAALAHAFSMRGACTPAVFGREIRSRLG